MSDENNMRPSLWSLQVVCYVMLGGGVAIALISLASAGRAITNAGLGILIAGASALAGGLLGFLFGIPRALQASEAIIAGPANSQGNSNAHGEHKVRYGANTNLEQISDWLTKILVGVGLTQMDSISKNFLWLAGFLSQGFDAIVHADVLASAILAYFLISGFLFGYLWTRLFLPSDLRIAELSGLGERISEIKKQVSELEEQASRDAKALSLAQNQLNPHPDSSKVQEVDLVNAIKDASPFAKATIFNRAWEIRSRNWRADGNKPLMELTAPIFRGLIAADDQNKYHANHGQLGFVLKDKLNPEWAEAEKELSRAIEIRGDWETYGWLYYEFNRAICRIEHDEGYRKGEPSKPEAAKKIVADLRAAAKEDELRDKIAADPRFSDWMRLNATSMSDLLR